MQNAAGRSSQPLPAGASSLGLRVLLASLAALFLATIFCGWYFRDTGASGRLLPPLPWGLWLTSLLLLGVSAAAQLGIGYGKGGNWAKARQQVRWTLVLGVLFLLGQAWNWRVLLAQETGAGVHPMYTFNFYLTTALHAAHIIGGLVYAAVVSSSLAHAESLQRVRNLAHYWHFLAATWIVILLNLFAIRIPNPADSFLGPLFVGITIALLLAVLFYQVQAVRILYSRGEKAFAFFALLLPVAFLHIWARGEELDTQKMALRWGVLQALLLIAAMFTGTIYLGQFASNFETIAY